VLLTTDLGKDWQVLGTGFPSAWVTSLAFDESADPALLRASTFGRSAFELQGSAPFNSLIASPDSLGIMEMSPSGFGMTTLVAGGSWVSQDQFCHGANSPPGGGCDVMYVISSADLPAGVTATLNTAIPPTVSVVVPFTSTTGNGFSVTVTGTDSVTGISKSVKIPIAITACLPSSASNTTYGPGICGNQSNGCGGTYFVNTCTASAPHCYNSTCSSCQPQTCKAPLLWDANTCACVSAFHPPVKVSPPVKP
jgi:hypothetical protein